MKRIQLSKEQVLLNAATMLIQKVQNPDSFLELLTEAFYESCLIAGKTGKENFSGNENYVFELKMFIDNVASRLFFDEDVSANATADGLKEFLVLGGLHGYDGMLKQILVALGSSCARTDYTEKGMDWIVPNLGVLSELRAFVKQYEDAEKLIEDAA